MNGRTRPRRVRRALVEALVLVVLTTVLAIVSGAVRRPPVPGRLPSAFFRLESGARPLFPADALRIHEEGEAIFVDVRPEEDFVRGHIPGAINLPARRHRDLLHLAAGWLEEVPAVLYGAEGDEAAADDVAAVLQEYGFGDLSVFLGGLNAWREAGAPLESGTFGILTLEEDAETMPEDWDDETMPDDDWDDETMPEDARDAGPTPDAEAPGAGEKP